jgi:polysaccharide export outer membrane protein
MKSKIALTIALLTFLQIVCAEDSKGPDFSTHRKERAITPTELVKEFEAPPVDSYRLYGGDEIFIEIWARPELSGKHTLGPDGKITLPVSGVLSLSGLTRDEAQDAIKNALGHYYSDISATVRVDHYSSYHIYVLGRVSNPGALQFESQPTLLEVLTRAGSLPVGGSGAEKAGLVRCAVFRGGDKIVWIDLKTLMTQGNLALNIRLARNDLVYLPDADDQLVYVLGDVQHPGAFRLSADMSFLDAFSLAGGATEDADSKHIALIRPSTGKQREVPLKELLAGNRELNSSLEEGDIIFVPKRGIARFGYILQKTSPVTTFAILGSTLK